MDEEPRPESARRVRLHRLHPTGLLVAVVGLATTLVGLIVALGQVEAREDQSLNSTTDLASARIEPALDDLDGLMSDVEGLLIATETAAEDDILRLIGSLVEGDQNFLLSASVLEASEGFGLNVFAEAGQSQLLDLEQSGDSAEELAARIQRLADLEAGNLAVFERSDSGVLALARNVPTASTDWVIYVEVDPAAATFQNLLNEEAGAPRFSVFLGEQQTADSVLLSDDFARTESDNLTAQRRHSVDGVPVVLVVRPTDELLDITERMVPLILFLVGLAMTALLTPLANRLALRREEVRALSAQRDDLDVALAESRRIEQELRVSEHRYRNVLHSSPDIICRLDPDGERVDVLNRRAILGVELEKSHPVADLVAFVDEAYREDVIENLRRLRHTEAGSIVEFECPVHPNPETTEWIRIRGGRPQHIDDQEPHALVVITDVTEQKEEELRRAELEQKLVQSQRLEAVGQLAGGVAHDFNNILAAIVSGAELIADEVEGQVLEDIDEIRNTARRGSDLARQLLLFSRRDRGSAPEVVDINLVIIDVETMLNRTMDEKVRIDIQLGEELKKIHIDPTQIERVLMNLTINARDAMPEGGTVTISTHNKSIDQSNIGEAGPLGVGEYAVLRVSDTGTGMTDEVQQRVFEPFFSTKSVGKGTGLGLATVYGIVQGAQGHIEITSVLGSGTTFDLWFPETLLSSGPDRESEVTEAMSGGSERILLVEDENLVRESTKRLLEKRGYTVASAEGGIEALELAETGDFELLLTDVLMPGGMNGREVAKAITQQQKDIAVLYMTGHSDDVLNDVGIDDDEIEALILRKPFTEVELLRAIRMSIKVADDA